MCVFKLAEVTVAGRYLGVVILHDVAQLKKALETVTQVCWRRPLSLFLFPFPSSSSFLSFSLSLVLPTLSISFSLSLSLTLKLRGRTWVWSCCTT